jgi:hypothetical protein
MVHKYGSRKKRNTGSGGGLESGISFWFGTIMISLKQVDQAVKSTIRN